MNLLKKFRLVWSFRSWSEKPDEFRKQLKEVLRIEVNTRPQSAERTVKVARSWPIGGQSEVGRREADQWEDRVWRTRSHSCCRLDSVSQQKWEYIKTIFTLIKLTLGRCFALKDTFFLNLLLLESENFRREAELQRQKIYTHFNTKFRTREGGGLQSGNNIFHILKRLYLLNVTFCFLADISFFQLSICNFTSYCIVRL